ncbi:MAG: N-formylglutamate deformylase [Rhodospirillales bacterium]
MSEPIFDFTPGSGPILISCPHVGTIVPDDIAACFTDAGRAIADTDWNVHRLYEAAARVLDLPMITATHARYVIDLNRDPSGRSLYKGADNTELCPTTTFDREPIYREGCEPDILEVDTRRRRYHKPYHDKLAEVLDDIRARHGVAILFEGHSIRSEVPRFFEGRLPDFNLGTVAGESADGELAARVFEALDGADGFTAVHNGRFRGGYITRHFGRPTEGCHALQLEKAQAIYMDETPPYGYRVDLAARVEPVIRRMLETALDWVGKR